MIGEAKWEEWGRHIETTTLQTLHRHQRVHASYSWVRINQCQIKCLCSMEGDERQSVRRGIKRALSRLQITEVGAEVGSTVRAFFAALVPAVQWMPATAASRHPSLT